MPATPQAMIIAARSVDDPYDAVTRSKSTNGADIYLVDPQSSSATSDGGQDGQSVGTVVVV